VLKLNSYKEQEQQARATAAAAQEKYEDAKRKNLDSNQLAALQYQAQEAQSKIGPSPPWSVPDGDGEEENLAREDRNRRLGTADSEAPRTGKDLLLPKIS